MRQTTKHHRFGRKTLSPITLEHPGSLNITTSQRLSVCMSPCAPLCASICDWGGLYINGFHTLGVLAVLAGGEEGGEGFRE